MSKVIFHSLPVDWQDLSAYAAEWIDLVLRSEGLRGKRITYRFVSDDEMLSENRRILDHDYYTDIITFGDVVNDRLIGDIIISHERVRDNAKVLNKNVLDERDRVVIHGVLHLCGYDDHFDEERLKMRELEDKYLLLRP